MSRRRELMWGAMAGAVVAAVASALTGRGHDTAPTPADADLLDRHGVIVRHDTTARRIYLVFSADSMFEGAPVALEAMDARGIKGNFFFTGNFIARPGNRPVIDRIIAGGHYVGGHSDRHLLLADWDGARTPLVTIDSMLADVRTNIAALGALGIPADSCRWFLPPFEWIAGQQAAALRDSLGLHVINPTPEINTYRDYTTPDMPYYHSSDSIERQLYRYEATDGLSGAIVIIHLGTQDLRRDKLYDRLPAILDTLASRGYTFARF